MKLLIGLNLVLILSAVHGSEILAIFHTVSQSHYVFVAPLLRVLAERGHQITVVTPFSIKTNLKNYYEILTPSVFEAVKSTSSWVVNVQHDGVTKRLIGIYQLGKQFTKATFNEPEVKSLLTSNKKFDLILLDIALNEAMLGFGHYFEAPVVGVSVFHPTIWSYDLVGVPAPLSYIPNPMTDLNSRMNLMERIYNVYVRAVERFLHDFFHMPEQNNIYKDYFPDPKPSLYDLKKNVSLVLVNSHFSISYARPTVPNFIEIGGIQINRTRNPLPNDLQRFLDSAKDGAIYFSLGTNIKSNLFPNDKIQAVLEVFKSLKQKVVWKWDDVAVASGISNILVKQWCPQDDILAHPNINLFITHGGLLSTTEAIYHGVPILGVPVFADQFLNMQQAVRNGFGLLLKLDQLNENSFKTKIDEILENPLYTQNMKKISNRYRDQPLQPMDTAVYWIEYVIRHRGAAHMRSAVQDLTFIEHYCLDIIAIVTSVVVVTIYVLTKLFICMLSFRKKFRSAIVEKKKYT